MFRVILSLAAIALILGSSSANPIDVSSIDESNLSGLRKSWEWCVVQVSEREATVSCAVGYVAVNRIENQRYFMVPVYWPENEPSDLKSVAGKTKIRIEVDGRMHRPRAVRVAEDDERTPPNCKKLWCEFLVDRLSLRSFSMVVSYKQPMIDGTAYYLPLFEGGKSPPENRNFRITFFPSPGGELKLTSDHAGKVTALKTRVSVAPKAERMIAVEWQPEG